METFKELKFVNIGILTTKSESFNSDREIPASNSTKAFARMQELGRALPVGMSLPCPPVPENLDMPKTERYIALCKEAFRPRMQDKAAFYYLRGAEDFRALRAAVLALTDMTGRTIIAELHADEGSSPDEPTWGRMIADAAPMMERAPHEVIVPLCALVLLTFSLSLLANEWRERLDPIRRLERC